MVDRESLIQPVRSLLSALNRGEPHLEKYFVGDPQPEIYEHGLSLFAPFMGRIFTGVDGIRKYFALLNELLVFQETTFEDEKSWIVDTETMAVFLRGQCRFLWKDTSQTWAETFCYRIAIQEDLSDWTRALKVKQYYVWGDTGALYLASLGKLDLVSKNDPKVEGWLGKGADA